jgi:hypothetical protein
VYRWGAVQWLKSTDKEIGVAKGAWGRCLWTGAGPAVWDNSKEGGEGLNA